MNHSKSTLVCIFFIFFNVNAQKENIIVSDSITIDLKPNKKNKYQPIQFHLTLKNMHLWRGFRSTDEALSTAELYYISKDKNFTAGFWSGVGFAGNYTEFDYNISYNYENWTFSIWDINNYTNFPDADIFNYDIEDTSRFIDVLVNHKFDKVPVQLTWSTIVLGRDTYIDSNGNLKNAFSNYVEAGYTLFNNRNSDLSFFVGAAFSFKTDTNFYGSRTGISNIELTYSKTVSLFKKIYVPVSAKAMWNNLQEYGALEVAVSLF